MKVNRKKTGQNDSKFSQLHKTIAFIVEKNEFDTPETAQIDKIVQYVPEDCKDNFFHTFEHRCEYDIF